MRDRAQVRGCPLVQALRAFVPKSLGEEYINAREQLWREREEFGNVCEESIEEYNAAVDACIDYLRKELINGRLIARGYVAPPRPGLPKEVVDGDWFLKAGCKVNWTKSLLEFYGTRIVDIEVSRALDLDARDEQMAPKGTDSEHGSPVSPKTDEPPPGSSTALAEVAADETLSADAALSVPDGESASTSANGQSDVRPALDSIARDQIGAPPAAAIDAEGHLPEPQRESPSIDDPTQTLAKSESAKIDDRLEPLDGERWQEWLTRMMKSGRAARPLDGHYLDRSPKADWLAYARRNFTEEISKTAFYNMWKTQASLYLPEVTKPGKLRKATTQHPSDPE